MGNSSNNQKTLNSFRRDIEILQKKGYLEPIMNMLVTCSKEVDKTNERLEELHSANCHLDKIVKNISIEND